MTALLEYFVKGVYSIISVELCIYKWMRFDYWLSEHTQGPMSSDNRGTTVHVISALVVQV